MVPRSLATMRVLLLLYVYRIGGCITELKRDYASWCVKYHVDLEEVGGSFPEIKDHTMQSVSSLLCCVLCWEKRKKIRFWSLK